MELTETIDSLNKQLIDLFGVDTVTGQAMWRIVWSDDQYEKRMSEYTPEGFKLLFPQVMLFKKYSYIKERYVLERLVIVPEVSRNEILTKLSYEPMHQFVNAQTGEYLPPTIGAAKFIIDTVYASMGKSSLAKYKDPSSDSLEERLERVKKLELELFGDQSGLYGKTTPEVGEGIVVPSNYEKTTQKKEN